MNWIQLAQEVIEGKRISENEALAILNSPDDELLLLLQGAFTIRQTYYGKKVKLNMIMNAKSGFCPENCGYCSQSSISKAPIDAYPMVNKETILEGAKRAHELNVGTYCIVASGRGPTNRDIDHVTEAVREIKDTYGLKICACLGILKPEQAEQLKAAGVDRYNHNVNTSARHHDQITTSHTYEDRVNTVEVVKHSGISPCSGVIVGMKETKEDVVDMAFQLRELDADSIPVNFLHAIDGTPLQGVHELTPIYCLKVLSLFRYVCPTKEIRISGGREVNLKSLQPLGLYAANSIFIGDYLTTAGQEETADHQILKDLGFEVESVEEMKASLQGQ
ncbi:biotin synthase BioB [Halalkalibacterium halodurans]|uniref:Biotin synthase n=1 Tax=Halalkalibacterium halodurans (strain ATCC BAA-125 / DSM 18197 / FERM 7344 / JCM 9153 / C-125) TaxID=272558 RepID=BIOB_HALH5|nr:biotin synthase BioB [Halalkalibacterium halodurans]Q9KC26.1 RecName: Full=Biotin synthase [Halalkalibacterium halodurans C-125]MED4082381.1 biotin synthase BioB [Halalkalibacterium halodurans]MED4083468.1 biotin synthase BioB [Halalkalibacterium halodurans]MED4105781.1 biotin synthase BioB [Halalkalibacterium halodurans]MED4109893.1 biotin synthase BioB [Halalkalibacterium halodurans]MED4149234.1 biotin synthase BioB [Halalkalibacterium halodurans]